MASIKNLKKDINYVLGDIIEAVYVWETVNNKTNSEEGNQIIDEAIEVFDELITKVNDKSVEDRKKHLSQIQNELEEKSKQLVEKLNALA
ncbi:hypothetical protein ACG2LH_10275 [Zhouia sp. PK063]|uniref:hypothetical protein n=1 Tax=Zhouia sp. PK063 TaxID=3373602 RepID=UPI0037A2293C